MQISFQSQNCCFLAEFNQGLAAKELVRHFPLDSTILKWGDEIYFETGITALADKTTLEVDIGDIAYWSEGKCICVFFGATPISKTERPVPASPVVIIGKTTAGPDELKKIRAGDSIKVIQIRQDIYTVYDSYKKYTRSEKKLTQNEIDVLVQQLLAEKEKREK